MNRFIPLLVVATSCWCSSVAYGADPSPTETLFEQANAHMDREEYAEACPKYGQALAIDPKHVRTATYLAECYGKLGQFVSAWSMLQHARELAVKQDKDKQIRDEIDPLMRELRPHVSLVRVIVPKDVESLPGLAITREKTAVRDEDWGKEVAVDPGTYEFRATALNTLPWTISVEAVVGKTVEINLSQWSYKESRPMSPQRMVGFVGLGLGAAMLIPGSITGYRAIDMCLDDKCGPNGDPALIAGAKPLANASTALFAVGGAFAVTGLVLVLTAPAKKTPHSDAQTSLVVGPTSVGLRGTW